jgi:hypothetical protein
MSGDQRYSSGRLKHQAQYRLLASAAVPAADISGDLSHYLPALMSAGGSTRAPSSNLQYMMPSSSCLSTGVPAGFSASTNALFETGETDHPLALPT